MTTIPEKDQLKRIIKARMGVILGSPFFGSLLMRLPMVVDNGADNPTFMTNGKVIKYNEEFCASLDDNQLRGVLVHEVAHIAQGHLWRRGGREPEKWNHATDYAINQMLEDYASECNTLKVSVPWTLPPGTLIDPQFRGMSAEEIYWKLPDMPKGGSGGQGTPSAGQFEDPPPDGQDDPQDGQGDGQQPGQGNGKGKPDPKPQPGAGDSDMTLEDEWKIATVAAATAAQQRGNCPASIRKLLDELVNPKVPWEQQLAEFVRQKSAEDYSYRFPARRYLSQDVILPTLHSETMGEVVIGMDTSGSIYCNKDLLRDFISEAQGILDTVKPKKMTILYCDAKVHHSSEYTPGEQIQLDEAVGGGGTDFRPVFRHVEKMDEPPVCVIYLTDTEGSFPDKEPDVPVLWVSEAGGEVPWGEHITML